MMGNVWRSCLQKLQSELSATEFNTWIKPLQVKETDSEMALYAPNPFSLTGFVSNTWIVSMNTLSKKILLRKSKFLYMSVI